MLPDSKINKNKNLIQADTQEEQQQQQMRRKLNHIRSIQSLYTAKRHRVTQSYLHNYKIIMYYKHIDHDLNVT